MRRCLNLVTVLILAILVGISSIRADQKIQPVIQEIGGMKVAVWDTPGNSAVLLLQGGVACYPDSVRSTNSSFISDVDEYLLIGADVYEPLQYNYSNYNNAWVADLVRAISHRERIVLVGYSAGGVVAANFLFSNESANLTFTIIVSAPLKAPNGFGAGSIFDVVNREKIVNRKVALIYGSEDSGGFFNTKEGGKLFAEKFGLLYFEIEGADHHNAYHGKEGKDLRIQLLKQYGVPEFPVPSAVILPAIFLSYLIIKIRRKNK